MADLNDRQLAFVREYVVDFNGTQAAIRAGYAAGSAKVQASKLLTNPNVQAALAREKAERIERTHLDADRVIEELRRIAFADLGDLVEWGPDGVHLVDSSELTPAQRAAVASVTGKELKGAITTSIKMNDKLKALDLLGRHAGLFVDVKEIRDPDGILAALLGVDQGELPD